jgi:hypothetical protein
MEAEPVPIEDPLAPPQPVKKRRPLTRGQYKNLVRLGGMILLGLELYIIFLAIGKLVS